jgi:hypothetical protein
MSPFGAVRYSARVRGSPHAQGSEDDAWESQGLLGRAGERPDWRIATVGVLATLNMLCLPAPAMGANTSAKGIDGVKLGDTEAHVRAVLCKPSYCEPCGKRELIWGFQKTLIGRVGFDPHGHANEMWTASPTQATSKEIHPSQA